MLDFLGLNNETIITIGSALAAMLTFLAIAMPLVSRTEKKERYKTIIEKKRKSLYEASKAELDKKGTQQKGSARESMAAFYRVQELAGDASKRARDLVMQAGYRNPSAPLIYLVSRIVTPVVFVLLAMMFIAAAESKGTEVSEGMMFFILIFCAIAGFFLPRILIKNTADKRQKEISLAFPDALDMMLICVQGGIGIEQAISKIADTIADHSETLAEEMGLLSAELGLLNDRRAAFQGFARRVGGGSARSFANAMLQAEQYGTSVSKAIRVLADEQRDQRMALAEQKAASLPPKLTVPMILFFLPALFITILGPAFLQSPK